MTQKELIKLATAAYQQECLKKLMQKAAPRKREELLDEIDLDYLMDEWLDYGCDEYEDECYSSNHRQSIPESSYEICISIRFYGDKASQIQFSGKRKIKIDCDKLYY